MKRTFRIIAILTSFCVWVGIATAAVAGTTVYKYDAKGQVVEIDYPNGTVVTYSYDAAGNRTQTTKTP